MNVTPLRRILASLVLLLLMPGCALLSRPVPLTTLQLETAPDALVWPSGLKPGRVTAVSALQLDRVILAEGARLMQHGGLRWVDVPAVMVDEYLRRVHARRQQGAATDLVPLDLWITDFHLTLDPRHQLTVAVAAAAELRCAPPAPAFPLAPASATRALAEGGAESVAAGFSAALSEVATTLFASASSQATPCTPEQKP